MKTLLLAVNLDFKPIGDDANILINDINEICKIGAISRIVVNIKEECLNSKSLSCSNIIFERNNGSIISPLMAEIAREFDYVYVCGFDLNSDIFAACLDLESLGINYKLVLDMLYTDVQSSNNFVREMYKTLLGDSHIISSKNIKVDKINYKGTETI